MRVVACLLSLLPFAAFGQVNNPPTRLYNEVVRSTYLLNQCGAMTPERQEWLDHLMVFAKRRMDFYTPAEKAQHDAALAEDIRREFATKPSKETCNSFVRGLDHERKTAVRDK